MKRRRDMQSLNPALSTFFQNWDIPFFNDVVLNLSAPVNLKTIFVNKGNGQGTISVEKLEQDIVG